MASTRLLLIATAAIAALSVCGASAAAAKDPAAPSIEPVLNTTIPSPGSQNTISFIWLDEASSTLAYYENRTLSVVGIRSGRTLWTSDDQAFQYKFSTVVVGDTVITAQNALRAWSITTGAKLWELAIPGLSMSSCVARVPGAQRVVTLNSTWDVNFISFIEVDTSSGKVVATYGADYAPWTKGNDGATVGCPNMITADFMVVGGGEVNSDGGALYGINLKATAPADIVVWTRTATGYGYINAGAAMWVESDNANNATGVDALTGAQTGFISASDLQDAYIQGGSISSKTVVYTTYAPLGTVSQAYLNAFNAANGSYAWVQSVNFRADGWQGSLWTDAGDVLGSFWQTSYGTSNYVYYACAMSSEWATGSTGLNWCASSASGVGDHMVNGRTLAMLQVMQDGSYDTPWRLLVWQVPAA